MLSKKVFFSILCLAILFFPFCGGSPNLEPTTSSITVNINAQKLDVFDATSQVFIKHGFSIITSNERLGLITTDYKQLEESWGGGIASRLFGKKKPELQLTTNIATNNNISILTILPKGRIREKKGYYDEIQFSVSFKQSIQDLGTEIKNLAETKK